MGNKESKLPFINKSTLRLAGIIGVLLLAVLLLWHVNVNSTQSIPAMLAQVYFDGEYSIAGGEWKEIEEGGHISSTKGDVTLRGNFHLLTPDGEYVGIYNGDIPIAFYLNHINLTFFLGDNEKYVIDVEKGQVNVIQIESNGNIAIVNADVLTIGGQ